MGRQECLPHPASATTRAAFLFQKTDTRCMWYRIPYLEGIQGESVVSGTVLFHVTGLSNRLERTISTRQVVIEVPERVLLAASIDEADFARELRASAAVKMYEMGRLSSGRAAELAGTSRVEFLFALKQHRVFPLEAELKDLKRQHA